VQIYDKTLKELLKTISHGLLKILTRYEDAKFLDVQFPDVKHREPDLLVELPDKSIFHLEIQATNDDSMVWRCL